MDFVLRTHYKGFCLATIRNGGFLTHNKVKHKKNRGKASSLSSCSLPLSSRRVTAVHLSSEIPTQRVPTNQVMTNYNNPHSSDANRRLWILVRKMRWGKGFTHLKNMVVSRGELPDLAASRLLIAELCNAGKTKMAAQVVEFLEWSHGKTLDDVRIYNELILGLCKSGQIDDALKLFCRMEEKEKCCCSPDAYTYNILIHAMLKQRGFEDGVKFLGDMRSKGFEPDAVTRGIVVTRLCKEGRLDEAVELINSDGWFPCVESYNAVITGFCEAGRLMDAEKLLADMAAWGDDCKPTAVTFRILISTLCRKFLLSKAIELLESMMPLYGCTPDPSHYRLIIHSLCKEKKLGMAMKYVEVMISRGCYPNTAIFNTLLAALWKDDKIDAGYELFRELKSSRCCSANLGSYSIVIKGLSVVGRAYEAMQLLEEMFREGFVPDEPTYTKLITGLIREGRFCDDVIEILEQLEMGLQVELPCFSYNWFIKALCSVGETDRAIDVLVYMARKGCNPTRASYANVIEELARCGLGREATELMNELFRRGVLDKYWTRGVTQRIDRICG